jgi:hypothetical protein
MMRTERAIAITRNHPRPLMEALHIPLEADLQLRSGAEREFEK